MAIKKYERNGKFFWQVYIDLRSRKDRRLRAQRRINGITSELKAISEEKRLMRDLTEKLNRLEAKGARWEEVIERWFRQQELFPTRKLARTTIVDYEAMLRNWTESWLSRTASDITRADAREMFLRVDEAGRSQSFRQRLKGVINMIYLWGIEERMICGVHLSPVTGIEVLRDRGEKRPEILSIEEIRILLKNANEQKHPWYHIWVAAVLTGCRSGELHQLKKSDVEIVSQEEAAEQDKLSINKKRYGFIRVRRSWNTRLKQVGPTKAGYWRTVPVSSEFYWFLTRHLNIEAKSQDDYLLPRFTDWNKGEQARILRGFCIANRLPSVKFHTLRACFATQLISTGIPATIVMKICGWKDLKTMQRYIRLAGIDEAGATEALRFIPTEEAVMEEVASIFQPKRTR
ncbi:MAG: tyrosine-type recombinase/integrase [Bdellovibrionales bacterium]|nr:tyrosine-type recombinase/integrase [Bdellovibrionales bacterium]